MYILINILYRYVYNHMCMYIKNETGEYPRLLCMFIVVRVDKGVEPKRLFIFTSKNLFTN